MTYLEFLSLLILYMAWVILLLRLIMADETALPQQDETRDGRR